MKADYKNWVPQIMVTGRWSAFAVVLVLFVLFGTTGLIFHGTARIVDKMLGMKIIKIVFSE